ncbi:DEAD/DEAH box helicase [Candidatus Woesearchaeota archaeon]|nr:DEAD/DEAH box helicase [Candidatus Woesearchaeota archaeon]
MLKDFKPRLYQETIFSTAVQKNTLVVLPTGMGKTAIAMMLAVYRAGQFPQTKAIFMAPTKPLAEQHLQVFRAKIGLPDEKFALFTGAVRPETREALWKDAQFVFATPQGLENDIIQNRIRLEDVSLLVFDEAHRAVGDYSYVWIAKQYHKRAHYPRILALTASPGSEIEKIKEVCVNLHIEDVEIRTDEDPDVKPYVFPIEVVWDEVDLPERFKEARRHLESCLRDKVRAIKALGFLESANLQDLSKKALLELQAKLHGSLRDGKDFETMKAISLAAEAMKVYHALELLETQGAGPLHRYLSKLQAEAKTSKVKAVQNLVRDLHFKSASVLAARLVEEGIEHPKLPRLRGIIARATKGPDAKVIVFCQYRDTAQAIVDDLNAIEGVTCRLFVGQMKKGTTGLSQKRQIEMLDEFRKDGFNVICMTSVGEEGLDIPEVDLVVFYEPIPSAIRHIQRRGRTGRHKEGRVIILSTRDTRDQGYRWSAHHKEKRMHRNLATLRKSLAGVFHSASAGQTTMDSYGGETPVRIVADYREKGNTIIKDLIEMGADVSLDTLKYADYVASQRVGIEVKRVPDFVNSIVDKRLLLQMKDLKQGYARPLVVIEGEEDIYEVRNVHPNAIRGMLATIAVSYGIPIVHTRNAKDTAGLILTIARREQETGGRDFSLHQEKKPLTLREQQEYIVEALPSIGPGLARPLLERFGSVRGVMTGKREELEEVPLIGKKKAQAIRDVLDAAYEKKN